MKLSEAIRLNGMTKPQGYGLASLSDPDAPCALGGALQAIGRQNTVPGHEYSNFGVVTKVWPWTELFVACPALETCASFSRLQLPNTSAAIWHLNDHHQWTREQIAAWVETVEPAENPALEAEKVEVLA